MAHCLHQKATGFWLPPDYAVRTGLRLLSRAYILHGIFFFLKTTSGWSAGKNNPDFVPPLMAFRYSNICYLSGIVYSRCMVFWFKSRMGSRLLDLWCTTSFLNTFFFKFNWLILSKKLYYLNHNSISVQRNLPYTVFQWSVPVSCS